MKTPGEALMAAVIAFNLFMMLLWFLASSLRRQHQSTVTALRCEVLEMRGRADGAEEERLGEFLALADALDRRLDEADAGGPIGGRKALVGAQGELIGLCARFPELAP
ncbi:hypothetical protein L6R50_17520 [Myxococcota bacterium]|nr:hypothetical protein [Myxococcota bacterium]